MLTDIRGGSADPGTEMPAKCPDCGGLMADMGLDFKAPKKESRKAWEHIHTLYQTGITFHSCGCSGPGYIPVNTEELIRHLEFVRGVYKEHLDFWIGLEKNPKMQSTLHENGKPDLGIIFKLPPGMQYGKASNYDPVAARKYWSGKIQEVEERLGKARKIQAAKR